MKRYLIHPPFADPTQPYLSLPTLKGYLRSRGLDATVLDLNLEAAHHLFAPAQVRELARRVGARFHQLNAEDRLTFHQQREYRALANCRLELEALLDEHTPGPIEVFQDAERFYDPVAYSTARRLAEGLFAALSAVHFPYRFGFNRAGHEVLPWTFDDLETYVDEGRSPLVALYRSLFEPPEDWNELADRPLWVDVDEADFFGISVVFPSQIPEALYLCRYLKRLAPQAFVALGGPSIHQIAVHLDQPRRGRLLSFVDGVGLFEGEGLLAELFPRLEAWRAARSAADRRAALADVPNLLLWNEEAAASVQGPTFQLDLREAPAPDYDDLDLDRYLAPSRTLLYAPTRGCYWNKCSFCYYGLSETATARYREVPPERAAQDLARLQKRHGLKNVYLSCDVLAPRYAVAFAEAVIERGLTIRWSSDLKIEPYFTRERCALLFLSGLRAAAFGIESGSDRILELMRKGCDRATMTRVNRDFHEAGVATQWMTFTDHPGESEREALDTVAWIDQESQRVALFLVGEFGLEPGSHVAQEPRRYGVEKVFRAEGDELGLYLLFNQIGGPRSVPERERVDDAIGALAARYASKPYPWAGAISTHHTFLHLVRFGPQAFKQHFQVAPHAFDGPLPEPPTSHIAGLRARPHFSLKRIEETEDAFFAEYLPRALYTTIPARREGGQGEVSALSPAHFAEAASEVPSLRPQ